MANVQKGGVIILSQQKPTRVAVLYQAKHDDYSLPKGHVEQGETPVQCAVREVKEETGLDVEIIKPVGVFNYHNSKDGDIDLFFFLGKSLNDTQIQPEEGSQVMWMQPQEVASTLSYSDLGEFFARVLAEQKEFFE